MIQELRFRARFFSHHGFGFNVLINPKLYTLNRWTPRQPYLPFFNSSHFQWIPEFAHHVNPKRCKYILDARIICRRL